MSKKVKVYTTSVCPYCNSLKQFLKENDVDFEEVDLTENEEAKQKLVKETKQMGVPVTEVDGEFIVGFNREKITEVLNLD